MLSQYSAVAVRIQVTVEYWTVLQLAGLSTEAGRLRGEETRFAALRYFQSFTGHKMKRKCILQTSNDVFSWLKPLLHSAFRADAEAKRALGAGWCSEDRGEERAGKEWEEGSLTHRPAEHQLNVDVPVGPCPTPVPAGGYLTRDNTQHKELCGFTTRLARQADVSPAQGQPAPALPRLLGLFHSSLLLMSDRQTNKAKTPSPKFFKSQA